MNKIETMDWKSTITEMKKKKSPEGLNRSELAKRMSKFQKQSD